MKSCIFLSAAFFIFGFAGCKKDNTGNKPDCRIVKISEPLGNTEVFSYDAKGRILKIDYGSWATSFSYVGDSIIKDGAWKSVYALNSNGLLAFERREYNSSSAQWQTRTFEYEGTQLKKLTAKSYSGDFTRTYTWSNGNMVLEHTEGNLYTQDIAYEYYTDKPYGAGDAQSWDFLENGVETIRNKNLLKKYTSTFSDYRNPDPTNPPGIPTIEKETGSYTYTFDSDGKIISMTAGENNSTPSTYTYEYQCN